MYLSTKETATKKRFLDVSSNNVTSALIKIETGIKWSGVEWSGAGYGKKLPITTTNQPASGDVIIRSFRAIWTTIESVLRDCGEQSWRKSADPID